MTNPGAEAKPESPFEQSQQDWLRMIAIVSSYMGQIGSLGHDPNVSGLATLAAMHGLAATLPESVRERVQIQLKESIVVVAGAL